MNYVSFILATILLMLSFKPCSDFQNCTENQNVEKASVNSNTSHNHQQDDDDSCTFNCFCNCCGSSITLHSFTVISFNTELVLTSKVTTSLQSNFANSYLNNIWDPPQLIS